MASELIEEVMSKKGLMINLVDIKSLDSYTYQHSVNVAVISLVIGIEMQMHKFELLDLCIGALVHDIGKAFIPKELLNKEGKITNEEYRIIQQHTTKGYEYLRGVYDISVPSRIIALQHHEKISGQGYPEGRNGEIISNLSKIVAVANIYDSLTSERIYRKAMSPNEAIEYIMATGGNEFDYKTVRAFAKSVVPYPVGTLVKLSTGDIAVVENGLPNLPLRPDVKIVYSKNIDNIGKRLELIKEIGVVIEDLVNEVPED